MIKTYGLTHVALAVKDAKRSFEFYRKVFGVKKVYDSGGFIQAQTPGSRDVLVFDEGAPRTGKRGGIEHFGFRLTKPKDVDLAEKAVKQAGGKILDKGEFCPGEPYLFCADPDGYVVEIWYEIPTKFDPAKRIDKSTQRTVKPSGNSHELEGHGPPRAGVWRFCRGRRVCRRVRSHFSGLRQWQHTVRRIENHEAGFVCRNRLGSVRGHFHRRND